MRSRETIVGKRESRIYRVGIEMSYAAKASRAFPASGNDKHDSIEAAKDYTHNMGALLSALSTVLSDTLSRFEAISSRVTERVLTRGDAADHDLIVALQDFDRLQQEFAALGDVISHCATVSSSTASGGCDASLGHAMIADITLSDIKSRLLKHLRDSTMEAASTGGDEQVF